MGEGDEGMGVGGKGGALRVGSRVPCGNRDMVARLNTPNHHCLDPKTIAKQNNHVLIYLPARAYEVGSVLNVPHNYRRQLHLGAWLAAPEHKRDTRTPSTRRWPIPYLLLQGNGIQPRCVCSCTDLAAYTCDNVFTFVSRPKLSLP